MTDTNLETPNIFDNTSSDITQNTFLEWLLKWADKKYENTNEGLHSAALDMLELFFDEKIDVNTLKIIPEDEHIDLWLTINKNLVLVIEDKNTPSFTNKDLDKYKSIAEDWCENFLDDYTIKYIYYKTEDYGLSEIEYVKEKGFKPINRQDILSVLEKYYHSSDNDFIKEYYLYLSNIENTENEVFEKPFDEIKQSETNLIQHMNGFCNYFSSKIGAQWKFVNAPTKPFVTMFWNWTSWKYGDLFLQFENFDLKIMLNVKLRANTVTRITSVGEKAWEKIEKYIQDNGYSISKCNKFGIGQLLILANIDESMWLAKDISGKLDKSETLKKLKSLDFILKDAISD